MQLATISVALPKDAISYETYLELIAKLDDLVSEQLDEIRLDRNESSSGDRYDPAKISISDPFVLKLPGGLCTLNRTVRDEF